MYVSESKYRHKHIYTRNIYWLSELCEKEHPKPNSLRRSFKIFFFTSLFLAIEIANRAKNAIRLLA